MRTAILTANLNSFDKVVEPVKQEYFDYTYHCYTDDNFPPCVGLTPRFQYRIPKTFSWQMMPGYDYYLWLDGSMTLPRPDSLKWFIDQLEGGYDIAVFKHPWRNSITEEVNHLENYLNRKKGTKNGQQYLIDRYANGFHNEQLQDITYNQDYVDDHLYASTAFIFKDAEHVRDALREWWLHQSRYYTCDQLSFTYALRNLAVKVIPNNVFKNEYITIGSKHK